MRRVRFVLFLLLVSLAIGARHTAIQAQATIDTPYGTFHSLGLTVNVPASMSSGAMAAVEVRESGGGTFHPAYPLTRIDSTRFVGSLFFLEPGTSYDIHVTVDDGGSVETLSTTGVTRAEVAVPTADNSYFVSPTGSNGGENDCADIGDPCATVAYALDQAGPGDEVVLLGGVYYQGDMTLPRSGAEGSPIVIRGYDGETAVLDGADPDLIEADVWTHQGDGVWSTAGSTHQVFAGDVRLYPYHSLADLQDRRWGIAGGFNSGGGQIYVRLPGDANPNNTPTYVSHHTQAFEVYEQDYIYFQNLHLRHYGGGEYSKAIYFYNASHNLVEGCTIYYCNSGIGIKYGSHSNVIQDNEFYDASVYEWPWAAVKDDSGLESGAVVFYSPTSGRGTVIRRNVVHDTFDGMHVCPEMAGGESNEVDVYENAFTRINDDGIETDGTCRNVRIWGNHFDQILVGVSLAPVYDGPVYVLRNLFTNLGVTPSTTQDGWPASSFKFNSGYDPSGEMYLFHNTAYASAADTDALQIKNPGSWASIMARNNIWAGTRYALSNVNTSPVDLDYDELYTTAANELVYWGDGANRHMRTLADFQANTGQELHGLSAAPGFVDAANNNCYLDADSPLIDRGVRLPGINDDYLGGAPDIGAFEADSFVLRGIPNDRRIDLNWTAFPASPSSYAITYTHQAGANDAAEGVSPITGLPAATLNYALTGLTNYATYTITVGARGVGEVELAHTAPVVVFPTDHLVYLPLVTRQSSY
ncbi:MAG: right-handed parallel beta-helix repeat-containing protein [Anaerolineae bacterium]|nr:right-handed parallel beta-helix repeat-containing protein [Anaerolineae bacterium]